MALCFPLFQQAHFLEDVFCQLEFLIVSFFYLFGIPSHRETARPGYSLLDLRVICRLLEDLPEDLQNGFRCPFGHRQSMKADSIEVVPLFAAGRDVWEFTKTFGG